MAFGYIDLGFKGLSWGDTGLRCQGGVSLCQSLLRLSLWLKFSFVDYVIRSCVYPF